MWLRLGAQSFGGGAATLALIRRAAVDEEGWVTDAEFGRFWSLVQLAPGINLLALTILLGRRAAGRRGVALALAGLLLPSVAITILFTAFYARVQHDAWVSAALRGIIPATVGLGLLTAWQIARPVLSGGRFQFLLGLLILLGSGAAARLGHLPVPAILGTGGAVYACWNWGREKVRPAPP